MHHRRFRFVLLKGVNICPDALEDTHAYQVWYCSKVETPAGTLGPFCGSTPPPSPLLTHSSQVHVRFTSDHIGSNKGFSLNFKTRGTAASWPAGDTTGEDIRLETRAKIMLFSIQERCVKPWQLITTP